MFHDIMCAFSLMFGLIFGYLFFMWWLNWFYRNYEIRRRNNGKNLSSK